ncbi:5-methylcytosine-specific restriction enzyme subunit McrC [Streptococcus cristatus]|uniref:5-methylcytosine-specific restriction enzyme subunit McrC n=1 Tax=Streptococcus cristatus TaxID=45634 RepID=A0A428GI67_STRCR|nr:McrC family protein [Streptococcus cristatus]RSJ76788.1 5-methylcytosine-specific restriction enzyme subunit McrC [Streptococcus cristatus]
MKPKILTVREFQGIKKEDLGESNFILLEEFIEENSGDDVEERLSDFLRISSHKGVKVIKPRNYVGVINIDNKVQIEILPKIDIGDEYELRKLFLKMLSSLKAFKGKSFKNAQLNDSKLPIYEVFIQMYLNEVQELLKKGLKSDYITLEGNLPFFKGKLLVNKHIKQNIVRKDRFYMAYDEFHINRPENRLIKTTLLKLNKISSNGKNQLLAKRLLAEFEMVNQSTNIDKDFSLVKKDRNAQFYQNLIDWSEVFLKNKSFSTFKGIQSVNALLFPMEKIFEAYIAKQLKTKCSEWKVETQKRSKYLFDRPRQFRMKPDIYMSKDDSAIVLDTKWKKLIEDKSKNYGISQSDMYQMYAYAYKYDVENVILIYPKDEEVKLANFSSYIQEGQNNEYIKKIVVKVFLYDLSNEEKSIEELGELINKASK